MLRIVSEVERSQVVVLNQSMSSDFAFKKDGKRAIGDGGGGRTKVDLPSLLHSLNKKIFKSTVENTLG